MIQKIIYATLTAGAMIGCCLCQYRPIGDQLYAPAQMSVILGISSLLSAICLVISGDYRRE